LRRVPLRVPPSVGEPGCPQDAADDYALIRSALRDAIAAHKTVWGDCPGCGKKVPVQVNDHQSAIRAVDKWMELGFGRTPIEKENTLTTGAARLVAELESLSTDDLAAIAYGELKSLPLKQP
jgi:hypothetical protein